MYYLTKNNSRDELYHYGVLGQRWGIRRYQNPDGTYTTAGKARRKMTSAEKNKEYARKAIEKYGGRNAAKQAIGSKAATLGSLASITGFAGGTSAAALIAMAGPTPLGIALAGASMVGGTLGGGIANMIIIGNASKKIAAIQDSDYGHDSVVKQEQALDRAKSNDRYDLNFLEFVQNKQILKDGGKPLYDAYSKYLDNPDKFITEDLDKYKDMR